MLENTIDLVLETPLLVIPLLPALYVTWLVLWHGRRVWTALTVCFGSLALLPVFVLFVLWEATSWQFFQQLAAAVFDVEVAIAGWGVGLYDTMLAAWLQLSLLVIDGLVAVLVRPFTGMGFGQGPTVPAWLSAFCLHFVGGAMLVYSLYSGREHSLFDSLLRGGGGVFLITGLFVALLNSRLQGVESSVMVVLLMAVIGLEIGVAVVLLTLQPDFSTDETAPVRPTEDGRVNRTLKSLGGRLRQLTSRRSEE